MLFLKIAAIVLAVLLVLVLGVMCVCFFMTFYSFKKIRRPKAEHPTPPQKVYDPYRAQMIEWMKDVKKMEHRVFTIKSHDGLTLCGKFYEYKPGAPIELMFHGYKGTALRDLCGGVHRCFEIGHSAFIVDHRAAGDSDGRVITFGIKESFDAVRWANFIVENIDPDAKIIMTGISMGAATVLTAASMDLPENVVGILADCGYTSTKDIIKKVMRDMKLPANILYPFARLSARVFGGFDPEERSPIESMKKAKLPIIFFHGDVDDYVPCYMSEENFAACTSEKKRLVITPGAGHGLCFPVDTESYLAALREFFGE